MSINKYNSEGYNDPTTYEALTNIDKQDKAAKKAAHFCLSEKYRPLVYICSPYSGTITKNVKRTRKFCHFSLDIGRYHLLHIFYIHSLWTMKTRKRDISQLILSIMFLWVNAQRCGCNGIKLRKSRITHSVIWDFFMEKY